MRAPWLAAALTIALGMPLGASGGSDRADVALVLAIDVSGSVDDNRFKLQREGIASALESEEMAASISNAVNQTIEIAVIEWAEEQRLIVPWTVLHGPGDLAALAPRLRSASRSWMHTMTDPGGDIAALALPVRRAAARRSLRQIIDVSGDGRQRGRSGNGRGARCRGITRSNRKPLADSLRRGTGDRGLVSQQCGRRPRRVSHRCRQL